MGHSFPMARAGGLFIFVMGVGVVLGALFPARRRLLLIFGAAAATLTIVLSAARLSAPFGSPTRTQVWFLFTSIGVEILLIRVAVARYRNAGERSLLLAILFVVGLHFLPMAIAFGPLCAVMGISLSLCSGSGLWLRPKLPLNGFWAADGMLKIGFGAMMFLFP